MSDVLRIQTVADMESYHSLHKDAGHEPACRFHETGFVFDHKNIALHIWWGGYRYEISLEETADPIRFLGWLSHIGEKGWRGLTPYRVTLLIEAIARRHGWMIHGRGRIKPTLLDRARQRALLTPRLRMDVLERDNFRCQMCGGTAEQGSVLHMDHILPVSRGGATTLENLQTLCAACNLGKSA